jgi:hypothetical protein
MASLIAVSSLEKTVKRVGSLNVDIRSGYTIAQPFPVRVLASSVKTGTVCDRFSRISLYSSDKWFSLSVLCDIAVVEGS